MVVLRQGKAKDIMGSSINSALTAVEIYNKPRTVFRLENYIVLMIIAWTKIFHAFFHSTMGEKYFYKDKSGHYVVVSNEKKAWELSECMKKYHSLPKGVVANLELFIGLRNMIEHRYWNGSTLDIVLFGECQSMLYNYENFLVRHFGQDYSINTCLAYSLQFSQLRSSEQINSQRQLLSKDMQDIKKYIDKYKTDLPQTVFDSQEFSIKLLQIPKVSNTDRADLSVEFVNWYLLSDEDKICYERICAMIKEKRVVQKVSNVNLHKPSEVISLVKQQYNVVLKQSDHTYLWKAFNVRPQNNAESRSETSSEFYVYDKAHNDYLYTDKWVEFIVNLLKNFEFTVDNIKTKCKDNLCIEEYRNK